MWYAKKCNVAYSTKVDTSGDKDYLQYNKTKSNKASDAQYIVQTY